MAAGKIDDRDIAKVAARLGDWQIIAKALGFGGQEIEDIETKNGTPAEQRKAVVRNWIRKNGKAATYEALAQVVEEFGYKEDADAIHDLPSKRYPASVNQQGTDAPGAQLTAQPPPQQQPHPQPQPTPVKDSYEIKRCKVVIINNHTFKHMPKRTGTDEDAKGLEKLFEKYPGFSVERHNDQTTKEMRKVLQVVAKRDHSAYDCLIVAILSHGEDGKLYGKDSKVGEKDALTVVDLSSYFNGKVCPTLNGKPKLFILQACRGNKYDTGVQCVDGGEAHKEMWLDIQAEADRINLKLEELFHNPQLGEEVDAGSKLPITADMLYAFSTAPGYFAWRDVQNGSVFIQTFIDVLKRQYKDDHLTDMLTMVNDQVAREFESHGGMKQMSSFTSQLRKKLYFRP